MLFSLYMQTFMLFSSYISIIKIPWCIKPPFLVLIFFFPSLFKSTISLSIYLSKYL